MNGQSDNKQKTSFRMSRQATDLLARMAKLRGIPMSSVLEMTIREAWLRMEKEGLYQTERDQATSGTI